MDDTKPKVETQVVDDEQPVAGEPGVEREQQQGETPPPPAAETPRAPDDESA